MKNLFKLVLVLPMFIFCQCDKDDTVSNDPIVGNWKILQQLVNDVEIPFEACDDRSIIEFMTDGKFAGKDYEPSPGSECSLNESFGTWENLGNNIYSGTLDGVTGEVAISFLGDTFTVTLEEEGDIYKTTYKRLL